METKDKKEKREGDRTVRDSLDLVDLIHDIAAKNARATLNNEKQLTLYLQSWWSNLYNRPLKDPLLLSYTLEELLYEFYDRIEREKARYEQTEQETDKIEDDREKDNLDWAEEEERKEMEALKAAKKDMVELSDQEIADSIINDPENQKWMQEQLEKEIAEGKATFGEDFGEDIEEEFNG